MCVCVRGPGSSVGITTDYWLDGPGSNPGGDEIFRPCRSALGPTQPPVKWVPRLSRGKVRPGRAADHSPLPVPRSWKSRAIPLPTLWTTLYLFIYIYVYIHTSLFQFPLVAKGVPFIAGTQSNLCPSVTRQNTTKNLSRVIELTRLHKIGLPFSPVYF